MQAKELIGPKRQWLSEFGNCCVGCVTDIDERGVPYVDFPGNPSGPLPARLLASAFKERRENVSRQPVLLVFEYGDFERPVILGYVDDTISLGLAETARATGRTDVVMDGKSIRLEACEEILLTCGKGSITLKKDGKIIIKGTEIVSRSSGANKIRGASVSIN
jgi:hypothetical protein